MKARIKSIRILNGYRVIFDPKYHRAMKSKNWLGYVYEHVKIVEKYLKRRLTQNEVVHHLDGDRSNNKVENLLVIDRGQHLKLHKWINRGAPLLKSNGMNAVNSKKSKTSEPNCLVCGITLQSKQIKYCSRKCSDPNRYGIKYPDKNTLKKKLQSMSREAIGREFSVSGNSVKKWAEKYNLL